MFKLYIHIYFEKSVNENDGQWGGQDLTKINR